ncbi:MAG: SDR family oxidoreductase [Tepidisphaerales bacterium]
MWWHGLPARYDGERSPLPQIAAAHGLEARATEDRIGPVDWLRRMMAIHVETPLLLCRALAPRLRQTRGHVINMLDILAERPWPKYSAYCASKAAMLNLTLSLARELAPEVTVNGIAPGVVQWPEGFAEDERRAYLARVPLGRAGDARDVANLVHFLVTDGAYITGQIIRVDGGRSLM